MKPFILLLAIFALFHKTWGHGMMLDPPGRSSRWRTDTTAPVNYNDNGLFCGGFTVQYNENDGKCGICGDNYRDPVPRANELGGEFGGKGVIVKTYINEHIIKVGFNITTNHLGHVFLELCNKDEFEEESEECFKNRLKFIDGSDKFFVGDQKGGFVAKAVLPKDINCKHCILRWVYYGGNTWNPCGEGLDGALGCGNQETFKSCADISIINSQISAHKPKLSSKESSEESSEEY